MEYFKFIKPRNKKLIQVCKLLVISLFLVPMLTGCFDAKEIDELSYVLAIGVDKGITDAYRFTIEFHTMKEAGGGSSGENGGSSGEHVIMTIDAPTFFTGIKMLNSTIPRRLNFMHAKFLVFSEEFAREGVAEHIAPIVRFREIRRTMHVIVSKGSASDFIAAIEPTVGSLLSKSMELIVLNSVDGGYFSHVTLNDFYTGLKSTYRQPLAILGGINKFENFIEDTEERVNNETAKKEYLAGELPRIGGSKVELYGSAIFNGDKMVGELTGEETRILNILTGKFNRSNFTIEDPLYPPLKVPLDVREQRPPKVHVEIKDGKPHINVTVRLEGDILAIQSRINYEEEPLKTKLENAFVEHLKGEIYTLIEKAQDLDSDIFSFGRNVCSKFYTIQDWEDFNWIEQFKNAEITANVEFTIRRSGTLLKSSPILTTEEAS